MLNDRLLGTLFIISAPSGGGKTSLVNAAIKTLPNLEVSISYTTRSKRPGEKEGVNYHFVPEEEFQSLLNQKIFLEYANVFGCYYGTSKEWVENKLKAGIDIILEIDWQGAHQIRSIFPHCVSLFILPPSKEVLEKRLRERAQDLDAVIARRMAAACTEISHYSEYDYLIVNDDFDRACADLRKIIEASRLRLLPQAIRYAVLLKNLLQ